MFDFSHNIEVGNTGKYSSCNPGCRIAKASQTEIQDFHGKDGNDQSCKKLRYAAHHRKKAVTASLHSVSENENRAQRDEEHGAHVCISLCPGEHG